MVGHGRSRTGFSPRRSQREIPTRRAEVTRKCAMPGRMRLSGCVGDREPNLEAGVAGFRSDLDVTAVLFYDALNCVETEAGAFANAFGCEKRFKYVRLHFGWNSGAAVADFDYNAIV